MLRNLALILLIATLTHGFVVHKQRQDTCGYPSCPELNPDILNVHLVPHSHDDVGWLKTVDQYFLGSNRENWEYENQKVGVTDVLDSVTRTLAMNPNRKYIQVESAFFYKWWQEKDDRTKEMFRSLVENGQLEFISGGWSMNDEGATHYSAIIDNMSLGFKVLNETFGDCAQPKIAWQIDPFGHSREQANLFQQMGFDGYFISRLDWRDKSRRSDDLEMEMIWKVSDDLESKILTGITYNAYSPPETFCWDYYCNDEPLMDNPDSEEYNIQSRIADFVDYVKKQAKSYKTNNILVCLGMDFHYQASHVWFKNIDKLIKYGNEMQNEVNLIYSSPSCYMKSLQEANTCWPTKNDDFFPYANDWHAYWTGYFTSRPTSKRMMHETNQILQVAKQMSSALHSSDDANTQAVMEATLQLDMASGISQHHDAMTGTEKQHVADDYHETLAASQVQFANAAFGDAGFEHCPLLNITQCQVTETNDVFFTNVYNPMAQSQSRFIRIPITKDSGAVYSYPDNNDIVSDIVPIPDEVKNIPGRDSSATYEIVFKAEDIPPLSSKIFKVDLTVKAKSGKLLTNLPNKLFTVGDQTGSAVIDGSSRKLVHLYGADGEEITVDPVFKWYTGHDGNNMVFENRSSGAYIFRPWETEANLIDCQISNVFTGTLLDELYFTCNDFLSRVIRLYHNELAFDAELEWLVGPIPIEDDNGKEIISTFSFSGIETNATFYTDSNGRQMMKRIRNYRETFELDTDVEDTEPVSQNYYPVNTRISLNDELNGQGMVTVLNDRSQGGSSIHDNEVELMIHRRLLHDDAFGVEEALNETAFGEGLVVRGKHYVLMDADKENAFFRHRKLATQLFSTPYITFKAGNTLEQSDFDAINKLNIELTNPLAENLHLLTLQPWYTNGEINSDNKFYLIRVEHIFQTNEHSVLSQDANFKMNELLSSLGNVVGIKETTLGGNIFKDNLQQMTWEECSNENQSIYVDSFLNLVRNGFKSLAFEDFTITLRPMEIRTFIVEIA